MAPAGVPNLNLSLIDPHTRSEFWEVVRECLIELHGLSQFEALQRSHDLRKQIETPPGLNSDLFYHNEPFQVACDITGQQFDLAQYCARYEAILQRHGW